MKESNVFIMISIALILIGGVLFLAGMSSLGWDFTKLSTVKFEERSYEITEDFDSISIVTDTADVKFLPSEDGKTRVECIEREAVMHRVRVENGALTVTLEDSREWYENFEINFRSMSVTVYLAEDAYGSLSVHTSTGEVRVPDSFNFANAEITVSTGNVYYSATVGSTLTVGATTGNTEISGVSAESIAVTASTGLVKLIDTSARGEIKINMTTGYTELLDVDCARLSSEGSTGKIKLSGVTASEKFYIKRSTGDVEFVGCDSAELYVTTGTGSVYGNLLTGKDFAISTGTGRVNVPSNSTGGRCEVRTSTGDVSITVGR